MERGGNVLPVFRRWLWRIRWIGAGLITNNAGNSSCDDDDDGVPAEVASKSGKLHWLFWTTSMSFLLDIVFL